MVHSKNHRRPPKETHDSVTYVNIYLYDYYYYWSSALKAEEDDGLDVNGVEVGGEVVAIIVDAIRSWAEEEESAVGDEAERNLGGIEKKNELKRTDSHGRKSEEKGKKNKKYSKERRSEKIIFKNSCLRSNWFHSQYEIFF